MSRCDACPGTNTCVLGAGPDNARIMLIGEAPGKDENKAGQCFVGKTGTELDMHFLPLAGLRRRDVYVTNACMCLPITTDGKLTLSKVKDRVMVETCAHHHLFEEIEAVNPDILVPMGAFACHVLDETIDLALHHGIPRESKYGTIFPMWHPAGGIHEPKKMLQIRTDWIRLKRFRSGTLSIWNDDFPNPDYAEVTSKSEIAEIKSDENMGCDTEFDSDGRTTCLTYSIQSGTARLIKAGNTELLEAFNAKLRIHRSPIIFHHWMADWPKVQQIGLDFPLKWIRDSMIRIHLLGNMPKGLKAFAYRELGMTMTDFEDVVTPYTIPRIIDYFKSIQKRKWPKPEASMMRDKTGKWKVYAPQSMNTKINRFFTDYGKNPDKDILEMWDNWEDQHEEIEAECGKYVGLDIRDVPFDEMLQYACRDADATRRGWPVLEMMTDNVVGRPQESWRV